MDPRRIEETLSTLIESQGPGLFRFLYWSLGREEDARDALQETLIRIHRGLSSFRGEGSLEKWAFRIATNVANDFHARRKRAPSTLGPAAPEEAGVVGARDERPPDQALSERETADRLGRALASLLPEQREALLLHAVSGMKYREIAEQLGIPTATVASRIHVARMKLQELLGEDL